MSWRTEWNAISNRIKGLVEAGNFLFLTTRDTSTENRAVFKNVLMPHSESLRKTIDEFLGAHSTSLSTAAIKCIEKFLSEYKNLCDQDWKKLHNVQASLTSLASFRSELDYHLSDLQAVSRRLTERAFIHLNRSIVADRSIRERWKSTFEAGEIECEKLGGVHLLSHGIGAFKASAEGERTDLILGEPLRNLAQVESAAEALVLTEWKVVSELGKELSTKSEQALAQAKRYSAGILAGFELTTHRYLIIVTKGVTDMPKEQTENEVTYKYINIAVDPAPPSKAR